MLHILFAGYLLLLSCFAGMCGDTPGATTQTMLAATHTGNDSDEDNCNPFCTCSCCISSTLCIHKEWQIDPHPAFEHARNYPHINQSALSSSAKIIWQPPRAC